ncbi:thioredoxin domain-containing protein 17-like [Arctopsyche grandis]|uniref:thioredoxin domain-containing protein 17-like n=1 Tax=Arctopsyche grandis TaxID=121162 RepID=UPI00406D9D11
MLSSRVGGLLSFGHFQVRQLATVGARMVVRHVVDGFEAFSSFVEALPPAGPSDPHFIFYTGSKDPDGKSWCPYCVTAEPVIEEALKSAPENAHFVKVMVGAREIWKDRNCPFRKDPRTKLVVLPTLVRWKGPQRLQGEECGKPELVEMMFQDFDD